VIAKDKGGYRRDGLEVWNWWVQTTIYSVDKQVLPYRMGGYIQYPMINHNGKESEKECITESLVYSRN